MTYDHYALEELRAKFSKEIGTYSLERPTDRRELLYGYLNEFFSDDWKPIREDFQYISARYFDEEVFVSYHSSSEEPGMAKVIITRNGTLLKRFLIPQD